MNVPAPPLLEARRVTAGYPQSPLILLGVDLALRPGETVGVIGPNGSGKSTLLRVLAGVLRPSGGEVRLAGTDLERLPRRAIARRIGVVPQSGALPFEFTVREAVMMGRYPHQNRWRGETAEDRRLLREALALMGLTELADRPVMHLSGGEQRRVAIARALCQQPEVLLLDEPFANLDVQHEAEVVDLLRRLSQERGMAVAVVLHDLNLAARISARLVLLARGRVVAAGTPAEVLRPAVLRDAYQAYSLVLRHPLFGTPHVVMVGGPGPARSPAGGQAARPALGVIGGGGTATPLLAALFEAGIPTALGPVHRGDTDQEVAVALGVPHVPVDPFSPFSPEHLERAWALLGACEGLIVADAPFGPGNLPVLELARRALAASMPVWFIRLDDVAGRDFTGGAAAGAAAELHRCGARSVNDAEAAVRVARAWLEDRARPPG